MKKLIQFLFLLLLCFVSKAQIADPVKWQTEYKILPDNIVELYAKAYIDKGYHMYGVYFGEGGPIPTSIKFENSPNYTFVGKVVEVSKPTIKKDPSFDNMEITIHNGKAILMQKLKLNSIKPIEIKASVEYMACTEESCLPPVEKELIFKIEKVNYSKNGIIADSKDTGMLKAVDSIAPIETKIQDQTTLQPEKPIVINEENSLLTFFLLALFAGLAGTITPCVFPMIPMTVSFFMRGNQSKTDGIVKGVVFGLSITAIYTLIGVLVSFTSIGSNFANQLSTHWIPNLIFFILFFAFALSFLGLFEIVLPSGIVNKADQQADKGGYVGIVFMALATVLISFSCTGPIVGALLVEAAGAVALKPIFGMFGFGLAFALPFTFFAIFPSSLNKLPKSGGWLNEVKVVMGLLMIALGMKFLVNMDQTYHLDLLSREIFLAIWFVISIILGLYLLGKIRLEHDSDIPKIGIFRLLLIMIAFVFAIYLSLGLFTDNPLKSISSFLPPQKEKITSSTFQYENKNSNICETPKYADLLQFPFGLKGYFDYNQALSCAKKMKKPLLIDFKGHACSNCKKMEAEVWSDPEVQKKIIENFILVGLYTDDRTKLNDSDIVISKIDGKPKTTIGTMNADLEASMFKSNALPLYVIVDESGNILTQPIGTELDIKKYLAFLENGINAFKKSE
jgi:thiol:disulfide interchange protein DsbD